EPVRRQLATAHAELEAQPNCAQWPAQLVAGAGNRFAAGREGVAHSRRHHEGNRSRRPSNEFDHGSIGPSTSRYPTPHTLITNRSGPGPSFLRRRWAWESSVLVAPSVR